MGLSWTHEPRLTVVRGRPSDLPRPVGATAAKFTGMLCTGRKVTIVRDSIQARMKEVGWKEAEPTMCTAPDVKETRKFPTTVQCFTMFRERFDQSITPTAGDHGDGLSMFICWVSPDPKTGVCACLSSSTTHAAQTLSTTKHTVCTGTGRPTTTTTTSISNAKVPPMAISSSRAQVKAQTFTNP